MNKNFKTQIAELKKKKAVKKDWLDFFKPTKAESDILNLAYELKEKHGSLSEGKKHMSKREAIFYKNTMGKIELAKLDCDEYNNSLADKNIKIEGQIEALKIEREAQKILENTYKQLKELVPADKIATFGMVVDGGGYKLKQIKAVKISCKKEAMKKISLKAEAQAQKHGSKGKTNQK